MKVNKFIFLLLALFAFTSANARLKVAENVYLFGFSASFTDSTIYITEIQKIDSALIETKGDFLIARDSYAKQLRNYFTLKHSDPHRTNIVYFGLTRKKAEKIFSKLRKMYTVKSRNKYDLIYLTPSDFTFTPEELEQ